MERKAGILLPISALPSKYGVGDFGRKAYQFIDLLKQGGYSIWQVLPLNPLGYGHSPYQPFSSYALEELYIDLDDLVARHLIPRVPKYLSKSEKVHYEEVRSYKNTFLQKAYLKDMELHPAELYYFIDLHPWVKDWALFMMLKRKNEMRSWLEWPEEDKNRINEKLSLNSEERERYKYEVWLQMVLYRQWGKLHRYAKRRGIEIMGDIPFYVGQDSADVWAHQDCFLLDPVTKEPTWIAGVPPDYFSVTGQRWGNPMYDWEHLEATGFRFLLDRLKANGELYDYLRIDHFRAFDTYWKIPASCPTAVEGSWIEAPGYAFFDKLLEEAPELKIIAEDLGDLRPEVLTLRDYYDFPGMNVVEFTFEDAEINRNDNHNRENMVAYIGTHDNDTAVGYYEKLSPEQKEKWDLTLVNLGFDSVSIAKRLLLYTLSLKCNFAIIAMQDILGLGSEARMNVPGVVDDVNWTWRLPDFLPFKRKLTFLKNANRRYFRK